MKTGLILEGGAMRGMFTAGVMDVLMEAGVEFEGAIGVSAGACFGCNYKSRQIGRVLRYNTTYARDKRYGGLRVLLRGERMYEEATADARMAIDRAVLDFERVMSRKDPGEIERARKRLEKFLDEMEYGIQPGQEDEE